MKILITGATGFVGKVVTKHLLSEDYELCLLVRDVNRMRKSFPSGKYDSINISEDGWEEKVSVWNPDLTIHLAAYLTSRDDLANAEKLVESNLQFPIKLMIALKSTNCKAFINTGSFAEYYLGDGVLKPNTLYAATKTALRPIIDYFNEISSWKWINVIFYTIYGRKNESKKVIDYMIDALYSNEPIGFSDGSQILDFIHVDDVADFFHTLLKNINKLNNKEEFHLGTGRGYSIREIGSAIECVFGKKLNAEWGKLPRRLNDHLFCVAPISNNIKKLNWVSKITLLEGIEIFKKDLEEFNK